MFMDVDKEIDIHTFWYWEFMGDPKSAAEIVPEKGIRRIWYEFRSIVTGGEFSAKYSAAKTVLQKKRTARKKSLEIESLTVN